MSSALADAVAALRQSAHDYWVVIDPKVVDVRRGSLERNGPRDATLGQNQSDGLRDTDEENVDFQTPLPREPSEVEVQSEPEDIKSSTSERQPEPGGGTSKKGLSVGVKNEPTKLSQEDDRPTDKEGYLPPPVDTPPQGRPRAIFKSGLIARLGQKLRSLFKGA